MSATPLVPVRNFTLSPDADLVLDWYLSTNDATPAARDLTGLTAELYLWDPAVEPAAIIATLSTATSGITNNGTVTVPVAPGEDSLGEGTHLRCRLAETTVQANLPTPKGWWEYQLLLKNSTGDPEPVPQCEGRISFTKGRPRP